MTIHRPARAAHGPLMLAMLGALTLAACAGEATVEEPRLISDASPFRYPVTLWDDGIEGETVIMVRVTDVGAVDSVYVLEASGHAAFDSAAVDGAHDLRFAPGRRDDRRVTMWARLPVRFHMNDEPRSDGATPDATPDATPGATSTTRAARPGTTP